MGQTSEEKVRLEISVLAKYGLRYAVLAAWADELRSRGAVIDPDPLKPLEQARMKISSGCFSTCEVGCDLGRIEAALVSAASSASTGAIDFWLELLGQAMADPVQIERVLRLPAIKAFYNNCGFGPCKCDT